MKTLIALKGPGNTGKSATLKKVYELLKAKYPHASVRHEITNHDVRAIMEIKGLKVGIESQGDPGSRLSDSLDLFIREQCVIIVCATRTWGATVKAVERHASEFDIRWRSKLRESHPEQHQSSNNALALDIFTEIEKLINT